MDQHKIDVLIVKVLQNTITAEESAVLEDWLSDDSNKKYFNEFVEINFLINSKSQFDHTTSLNNFKIITNKNLQKNYTKYLKYAAAVLIFISAGYFISKNEVGIDKNVAAEKIIQIGTDKATLTLEDGSEVVLEKGHVYASKTANSNGKNIIYKNAQNNAKETTINIAYNYLTIPRGGEFFVQLSDSTKVWLNSETKIKFPVKFRKGAVREVELIYGEAYFDVSSSEKHYGASFKVFTQFQVAEVLGTAFNIKAYKDENEIATTLVEGKVSVNLNDKKEILMPTQQLNYNTNNKTFTILTVNTDFETSWHKGYFSFTGKPLKEIMKFISRWYDIDIEFENKLNENIKFNGSLSRNQNIENILLTIKNTNNINYEIKSDKIIIK
jgi:ferric-dicitrate binding protein FerR (iron transport regulator)